jgi:phosphoserine phosphatase RsbU/P
VMQSPDTDEVQVLDGFYDALLDDDPEALYDRAPCGYVSATPEGTIIKVNQTFLDWTGHQRRDLVGRRSFVDLLTAGGRIYHETHYRPLLQMQGKVREIALDIVTANGTRLPVLLNSVLELDPDGNPVVIRTAIFDATERRGYERELMSAKQRAEEAEGRARALLETLQSSLLPPELPRIPGLDLAAIYKAAGAHAELGGDFYDVFPAGDDSWFVAVGDVQGKGVDAAILTGLARHALRAAAVTNPSPSAVLGVLNEVLVRSGVDRFVTAALVRVAPRAAGWSATLALAGHPLALLRDGDATHTMVGSPGSLLGVFAEPTFPETELPLGEGDLLVAYTDGVTEARDGRGGWFGEDRLRQAVARHGSSPGAVVEGILDEVVAFQRGSTRDDTVVVAISPGH